MGSAVLRTDEIIFSVKRAVLQQMTIFVGELERETLVETYGGFVQRMRQIHQRGQVIFDGVDRNNEEV